MRKSSIDFHISVSPTASPSQLEKGFRKGTDILCCGTIVVTVLRWPLRKCAQLDEQCAFGEMLLLCEETEKIEGGSKRSCLQREYKVQIITVDQR